MAFLTTTSVATTFIVALFLVLSVDIVSTATAVASGNKLHSTNQRLPKSSRQSEDNVNRAIGVFILCQQYRGRGPHATSFSDSSLNTGYSVDSDCPTTLVRGTANGKTETNHARVLNIPGLYDYYEIGRSCTGNQRAGVTYYDGTRDIPVFYCDHGSDATYVLFGAESIA